VSNDPGPDCEREVLEQLVDLQRHGLEYAHRDGFVAEDELFYAAERARCRTRRRTGPCSTPAPRRGTCATAPHASPALASPRLERAIGVVYRPSTERRSHYFHARVSDQFDALIHIDDTRAVQPLDRAEHWAGTEPAETYPAGV
jgi:hypothetical protein